MRFLQTSDWHLGKVFHEISLLDDQKVFLQQIKDVLSQEDYDALLVPGDIYDRQIPPSEAVLVFDQFLTDIHKTFPDLHVFLISGNHDSADRLSFGARLFAEQNIHLVTDVSSFDKPFVLESKSGSGEKCAVYQLPFLYSGAFHDADGNSIRNQNDLYSFALKNIEETHKNSYSDCISVVCAHLFTLSAKVEDSERSFVGTAEQVDSSVFQNIDYVAMGHLHSYQKLGVNENLFYAGSPFVYSFDDSKEKFLLDVEVHPGQKPVATKIPLEPVHHVVRLKGSFIDFYNNESPYKDDYVELVCTDEVIPEGAVGLLRSRFNHLLSLRRESKTVSSVSVSMEERKKAVESLSPELIFKNFIDEMYEGKERPLFEEEKSLFLEATQNLDWGKVQ